MCPGAAGGVHLHAKGDVSTCATNVCCDSTERMLCLRRMCAGDIKGVDSTAASHEALAAAKQLAIEHNCIVAVSGAVDLVRCCTARHVMPSS